MITKLEYIYYHCELSQSSKTMLHISIMIGIHSFEFYSWSKKVNTISLIMYQPIQMVYSYKI